MLTCELQSCGKEFPRAATGSPAHYCSKPCRNRARYLATSTRPRRFRPTEEERRARFLAYQRAYSQRPERKAAAAARGRALYATEEYRTYARNRYRRANFFGIEIPAPYTGHRWLDMAREATGVRQLDHAAPWADDYHDDMGEAVLALLEGRDMKQAIKEYRRKEYVPRRLTTHLGDWGDDEEEQNRWFDNHMPTVESAEDEAVTRESVSLQVQFRFNHASKGRHMKHKTGTPSNRRSNNK